MLYDFKQVRDKRRALLARDATLESEASTWYSHYQEIGRYLLPRSGRYFVTDRNKTDASAYNKIYDNTATKALRVLASGLMTGASSPGRPWFKLTTEDPELSESYSVEVWLRDVEKRMLRVFAKSNFYRVVHQMYEQLGAFGTSCAVLLSDSKSTIHLYPKTVGRYRLQQDYQGRVVAMFHRFEKTVGEVVKEYGIKNVSIATAQAWHDGELEHPVEILHVIEPRDDRERDPQNPTAQHMPWASYHIEVNSEEDKLLRESGYKRFPVLAPRWLIDGDDVYGTSPGMDNLGDIKQLQSEQVMKGTGIAFQVKPPVQIPPALAGLESQLLPGGASYIEPGATLPYEQVSAHGGVRKAFDVQFDLGALREDILDVRQRIREGFFADLFLMLAMAGPNTRMTATEVAERHEEKLLALGPMLERLHNELLQPAIELTFEHMLEAGLLPPPPPELQGQPINIEFVSILAQAQRAVGANAIDRFIGNVVAVAPEFPEVKDVVDIDRWARRYSNTLGVDPDVIREESKVAQIRETRAAAQAAEQQTAIAQSQAQTMQSLSQAQTIPGNALGDAVMAQEAPEVL